MLLKRLPSGRFMAVGNLCYSVGNSTEVHEIKLIADTEMLALNAWHKKAQDYIAYKTSSHIKKRTS